MRRKLTRQSLLNGDVIIVNIGVGYQDPRQENSDTINGVPWNHNRMSLLFRVNLGGMKDILESLQYLSNENLPNNKNKCVKHEGIDQLLTGLWLICY